jgi:hypothetical protein
MPHDRAIFLGYQRNILKLNQLNSFKSIDSISVQQYTITISPFEEFRGVLMTARTGGRNDGKLAHCLAERVRSRPDA